METENYNAEEWRDVRDFEAVYQISSFGRVRGVDRIVRTKGNSTKLYKGKQLQTCVNSRGYLVVTLWKDGKKQTLSVHRLVAEAFIPNPDNLPVVNHKDECKTNDVVSNLEWCDAKYNSNYGNSKKKIAEHHGVTTIQYNLEGVVVNTFESACEASRVTGISQAHISDCCVGKRKTAGGYVWKYKKED